MSWGSTGHVSRMSTLAPVTDTRHQLAIRITSQAASALENPSREHTSRMVILGHLLDPKARVVETAISRVAARERFSTVDRERIADYITRALERSVLGLAATPMDLKELIRAESPFAWSDRFAAACVQFGFTAVLRARLREVNVDMTSTGDTAGAERRTPLDFIAATSIKDRSLSAEELFFARERAEVAEVVADSVAMWDEVTLTAHERMKEQARATRALLNLPAATVATADRRWVAMHLKTETAMQDLRQSLTAHRDLAAGIPQWSQLAVDDRLLDLWMDYSAEQASTLLSAPAGAVLAIVVEAASFPSRPREQARVAVRRVVKNLSAVKGWSSLVMRLEKAWAAEFFDARVGRYDYSAMTDEEAEEARMVDAADWQAAAEAALAFPTQPFGPSVTTVDEVGAWISRAHRLLTEKSEQAGQV